jgi:hypothetical protein
MILFPCPHCGQTAEIQDRLRPHPRSPVTHVTIACLAGDWLILTAEEAEELLETAQRPRAS